MLITKRVKNMGFLCLKPFIFLKTFTLDIIMIILLPIYGQYFITVSYFKRMSDSFLYPYKCSILRERACLIIKVAFLLRQ